MPFSRPTLSDLKSQVASDIASSVQGVDPLLRFSNLQITGKVQAQLTNLNYGYLDYIAKQSVPFSSTDEFLLAWAALKGVLPEGAVAFVGRAAMSGVGQAGEPIPANTPLVRGDQAAYKTLGASAVAPDGSASVEFVAVVPGAAGTCDVGTVLVLGTSIAGVMSNWTVTEVITPGADEESQDSLKSRMLQVYQNPPQGGANSDYEIWARQVPGVTRAWSKANYLGSGTVVVFVMFDITEAAHGGIPQGSNGVAAAEPRAVAATGDQLVVANYIYQLQPATALVYVVAPVANVVNLTITGLASLSADQQQAVGLAISTVFAGVTELGSTVYITELETAIASAAGTESFHIASPAGDVVSAANAVPVLGTITWS